MSPEQYWPDLIAWFPGFLTPLVLALQAPLLLSFVWLRVRKRPVSVGVQWVTWLLCVVLCALSMLGVLLVALGSVQVLSAVAMAASALSALAWLRVLRRHRSSKTETFTQSYTRQRLKLRRRFVLKLYPSQHMAEFEEEIEAHVEDVQRRGCPPGSLMFDLLKGMVAAWLALLIPDWLQALFKLVTGR